MRTITAILVAVLAITWGAGTAFADKSNAHFKRGMAYKRKGDLAKATESFEAAVAANPKHGQAWASLGHLYKKEKKFDRAVSAYEKATALIANDATLWSNLGMSYYRAQKVDKAIIALEKGCRLAPKNAEIHANLGAIRRQKGDLKRAVRNLAWAVKLAPKEAPYRNNLGLAYRVTGSRSANDAMRAKYYGWAAAAFKKAIEIDPNEARYYFNAAVVYRRWEKVDDAIKYYQLALEKAPGMHGAWYDLGHMHKLNHDNDKAIEAFGKYLELTKGKDKKADKEVEDTIKSLGGKVKK